MENGSQFQHLAVTTEFHVLMPAFVVLSEPPTLSIDLSEGKRLYAQVDNVPKEVIETIATQEASHLTFVLGTGDETEGVLVKRVLIDKVEYWLSPSHWGPDVKYGPSNMYGNPAFQALHGANYC